jgi:hypothetical protein
VIVTTNEEGFMIKEPDIKRSNEEGFAKFMELPATRLMVSSIPAAEIPETMETLLRTAYESGHAKGMIAVLIPLIEESLGRGRR